MLSVPHAFVRIVISRPGVLQGDPIPGFTFQFLLRVIVWQIFWQMSAFTVLCFNALKNEFNSVTVRTSSCKSTIIVMQ